ncbi:Hypothetical Protein RSKD131_1838 [Cereibacter sphaeroides KD131]|nr:Hypothetical Protein RSKD131_1838 [Cereibacter sphaeroides KD131]
MAMPMARTGILIMGASPTATPGIVRTRRRARAMRITMASGLPG